MAAIRAYKVTQEFEYENKVRIIGEELALSERDADVLIKKHVVVEGRLLDPEDPEDQKKISKVKQDKEDKRKENGRKEDARQGAKDDRAVEDDQKRDDLLTEASKLGASAKEIKSLSRLETDVIEKDVEKLRKLKKK